MDLTPENMEVNPHVSIKLVDGVKILVVYIEGYFFDNFHHWWDTRAGEIVMKKMCKRKYKTFLKCVYFDNSICYNEEVDVSLRNNIIECVSKWTLILNESENIKCFTNCDRCHRFCTIQFHFDHVPLCSKLEKNCVHC